MILSIIPMLFSMMWGVNTSTINTSTVPDFDIDRYLGDWWEIARFENRFERGLDYVTAQYTMMKSGKIEVTNRGYNSRTEQWRQSKGVAKLTEVSGALKVSFFLWFYGDYLVMDIGEDYSWALVGSSSPDMLWILSRSSSLDASTLEHILTLAQRRGYDTQRFIYPEQLNE